jgi:hypothetical protein
MAARRATRWILEALDSIDGQEARAGWEYSLRVGVDGCPETSRLLLRAGRPHWYAAESVGPYVMRNSLVLLEPASAYAIFDADDMMRPPYLKTVLHWMGKNGIAGGGRSQINEHGRILRRRTSFRSGVAVISHPAWEKLGGYRAWPIAADHDLILRARALRIVVQPVNKALYVRRVHPASLTQDPATGFKTQLRREFASRARSLVKHRRGLYVRPVTVPLEYREP